MKKRILSILMSLCMVLMLMPNVASAEGTISHDGWTELTQTTIENYRVTAAMVDHYCLPSGNYYLGEDISVEKYIKLEDIDGGSTVTLDLNGFELKNVTNNGITLFMITCSSTGSTATLTLTDSSLGKTGKVINSSDVAVHLGLQGKLNANGGTVEGSIYNGSVIDNTDPSNVTVFTGTVNNRGTINGGIFNGTVNGGRITGGTFNGTVSGATFYRIVTFDSDGGSAVPKQEVLKDGTATEPTAPTRAGYSFEGWYNGDIKYDFREAVTENITLTARWKDIEKPVITGLENGKTYCEKVEFEVSDNDGIASVKAGDEVLTAGTNGKYTLAAGVGTVTVVVTDNSGNTAQATVTVNNGHTWNNSVCSVCDYICTHKDTNKDHICDICGVTFYGHSLEKIPAKNATVTATGNKEYWHCLDCGKYFADENGTNEIKLGDIVTAKLPLEIIEGKGQSLAAGEKKELTFRSSAAFSDFIRVELDGNILDAANYSVREGSTVVTLKADYVATLSAGEHTIGIVSTSGTAATKFTMNAKAVVDNDTKSPQTGDNSHMALWIALLFVSGGLLTVTGVYSKKRKLF